MARKLVKAETGFSLVELMIAIVLGLILISSLISIFAGNQRTSSLNSAIANLQESARFSMEQIGSDLKMSGYQGCADNVDSPMTSIATNSPTSNYVQSATVGSVVQSGDTWNPVPPAEFITSGRNAVVGSHALTVQFGGPQVGRLEKGQVDNGSGEVDPSLPLSVSSSPNEPFNIKTGDFAIVSNCINAELFEVTSVAEGLSETTIGHGSDANDSDEFVQAHGSNNDVLAETQVLRFNSNVYYVADTGLQNKAGDTITALYRQSLPNSAANPPVELIQGVENLRLAFGVRTASGLAYVSADDATFNAADVESVRIGLLLSSWDRVADQDDDKTYLLAGQAIEPANSASSALDSHPGDRRFRLAFNTTVMIRN